MTSKKHRKQALNKSLGKHNKQQPHYNRLISTKLRTGLLQRNRAVTVRYKLCNTRQSSNTVNMPNKSKASLTATNNLKQQLQLKVLEWNVVDFFDQRSYKNQGLNILRKTYQLLRLQKDHLDRSCSELMKLELISKKLTTIANESARTKHNHAEM